MYTCGRYVYACICVGDYNFIYAANNGDMFRLKLINGLIKTQKFLFIEKIVSNKSANLRNGMLTVKNPF